MLSEKRKKKTECSRVEGSREMKSIERKEKKYKYWLIYIKARKEVT